MESKKKKAYISPLACEPLKDYLRAEGFSLVYTDEIVGQASPARRGGSGEAADGGVKPTVSPAIALHPDIYVCKLREGLLYQGDPALLGPKYPEDVRYCACSTGRYFLHKLKYTDPGLLKVAETAGLEFIDIPQGYAKCNIAVAAEDAIITSDEGIKRAIERHFARANTADDDKTQGPDVLLIEKGHIALPGHSYGFIGGAGGLITRTITNSMGAMASADEQKRDAEKESRGEKTPPLDRDHKSKKILLFNGDLSKHPDFERILKFCEAHGTSCKWFKGEELTDIGSIICTEEEHEVLVESS